MRLRMFLAVAALTCVATTALATLSNEHLQWGTGPMRFLLTKEEAATWKTILADGNDEAAKAFIDLFWARRDPSPDTPRNEYREQIEARVRYADENLAGKEKVRGSMTDRGKALIVYGQPKRIERSAKPVGAMMADSAQGVSESESTWMAWIYEDGPTKEIFRVQRAALRFIDRFDREEFRIERSNIDFVAAESRAIALTIKQPDLKEAPSFAAAAPQPAPVAVPAAPPLVTELQTDALKAAVADLKTAENAYANKAYATWGEFVTSAGEYFVPVGLYVPKTSGITSENLTFFGVVEDATGKSVLAFEEPATVTPSNDDLFIDKSLLALTAGKHRGILGLAQNGEVKALATVDMELAGSLDTSKPAVSSLILSKHVFPLPLPQKPDDPFAFGGLRVIPKADKTFRSSDEIWYFVELRNPGLAAPPLPEGTVAINAAEVPQVPNIQVKMDVEGTDTAGKKVRKAAPPTLMEAIALRGVPGHFGLGNAFPASTFKPGEYTFSVKIIDTVTKASYTLSDKFKVVE